ATMYIMSTHGRGATDAIAFAVVVTQLGGSKPFLPRRTLSGLVSELRGAAGTTVQSSSHTSSPSESSTLKDMAMRTVIVAGATGLVGREILEGLLADKSVAAVHSLGRRSPPTQHAKLTAHVVDFASLPALPAADEVYLALGTTIKVAGSQAAFRAV